MGLVITVVALIVLPSMMMDTNGASHVMLTHQPLMNKTSVLINKYLQNEQQRNSE
jgi:hypothetical protein